MSRQIVLDTETTGLSPKQGHRIIEIGCVELINRRLTGNHFHYYINPERPVDEGAFNVHGISDEFLADKPKFNAIADEFFNYINGAELVIHNAPFDVGFIEHEFNLYNKKLKKLQHYCQITDTLMLARKLHPGQKNNLDILCKRYNIVNFERDLHGALLDSEILAQVYLAMTSGQSSLFGGPVQKTQVNETNTQAVKVDRQHTLPTRVIKATQEELEAHNAYLAAIRDC